MGATYVFAKPAAAPEYDRSLAWTALLLLAIGLVMVYSASIATSEASRYTGANAAYFLLRHAAFLGIALGLATSVFLVPVRYWQKARKAGLPVDEDFGEFYRAVEWMGLQRHLKVAGIFARLTLRDGKPRYLADAPRFIGYIRTTAARYRELAPLLRVIEEVEGTDAVTGFAFGRV